MHTIFEDLKSYLGLNGEKWWNRPIYLVSGGRGIMTRSELHMEKPKSKFMLVSIVLLGCIAAIFTALYFYSQSLITIEAPKKELGEKIIIQLPSGKSVFTYENLIVEEEGKLFYKGERNTLDLTGGTIVYEDWE